MPFGFKEKETPTEPRTFASCLSLDQLMTLIQSRKEIRGTKKVYTPQEVMGRVESLMAAKRQGNREQVDKNLEYITGEENLRDTVDKLTSHELETAELNPSLRDFKTFLFEKKDKIKELQSKGVDLPTIFYDLFYSNGAREEHSSPRELDQSVQEYNRKLKSRIYPLVKNKINSGDFNFIEGWITFDGNGGIRSTTPNLRRYYVNTEPEQTAVVFEALIKDLLQKGIIFRAKIQIEVTASDVNRAEQITVYSEKKYYKEVTESLSRIYEKYGKVMRTDTPAFTLPVQNDKAKILAGISIADNPKGGKSFGEIQSKILTELYVEAQKEKKSISSEVFGLEFRYREKCRKYGLDPFTPALSS